jgi:hypothetical protein
MIVSDVKSPQDICRQDGCCNEIRCLPPLEKETMVEAEDTEVDAVQLRKRSHVQSQQAETVDLIYQQHSVKLIRYWTYNT